MHPARTLFIGALAVAVVAGLAAPAAASDRVLGTDGAIITPPAEAVTRTLAPTQGCQTLLDSGEGDCTVVKTANGDLVVTVEPGPKVDDVLASRPWIVRVYRPSADVPDGWEVALETQPQGAEPGPLYAGVTAKAVDVTRDGTDELVIGYRAEGTGQILDVDIVGTDDAGTPEVLAHDQLYKGNVIFRHGQLVAITPIYKKMDANCCPTWIHRERFREHDGEFVAVAGARVKTRQAKIPPPELG
ncbi:MAG: hypothetical protein WEC34_00415 [Acidimicrobiia bacterium]